MLLCEITKLRHFFINFTYVKIYSKHYLLSSTAGGSCCSRNTSRLGVAIKISEIHTINKNVITIYQ